MNLEDAMLSDGLTDSDKKTNTVQVPLYEIFRLLTSTERGWWWPGLGDRKVVVYGYRVSVWED